MKFLHWNEILFFNKKLTTFWWKFGNDITTEGHFRHTVFQRLSQAVANLRELRLFPNLRLWSSSSSSSNFFFFSEHLRKPSCLVIRSNEELSLSPNYSLLESLFIFGFSGLLQLTVQTLCAWFRWSTSQ